MGVASKGRGWTNVRGLFGDRVAMVLDLARLLAVVVWIERVAATALNEGIVGFCFIEGRSGTACGAV